MALHDDGGVMRVIPLPPCQGADFSTLMTEREKTSSSEGLRRQDLNDNQGICSSGQSKGVVGTEMKTTNITNRRNNCHLHRLESRTHLKYSCDDTSQVDTISSADLR